MASYRIGVLGTGTWGIALTRLLANKGYSVTAWSAIPQEIETLKETHTHPNLPGMAVPESIDFTTKIEDAVLDKDLILFAVPSVFVRSTAERVAKVLLVGALPLVVTVAKGIESGTTFTMSQVIHDQFIKSGIPAAGQAEKSGMPAAGQVKESEVTAAGQAEKTETPAARQAEKSEIPAAGQAELSIAKVVALSGPTHAEEVAFDLPTAIVSACEDEAAAKKVQEIFMTPVFRVYTNSDIDGVELCGAMKNVIALTVGISKGAGFGDNAKAALITRGMEEIRRLGTAMGANTHTFAGLAGIGDLIVTATSEHSRNNRCGQLIGEGYSAEEAVKKVGMVVEGLNALPSVMELAQKYGVEVPITNMLDLVVNKGKDPKEAASELMGREKKQEF